MEGKVKITHIQRWFFIAAMWVGILFLLFVFYWVMVRPVRIRQMCIEKAKRVSSGTKAGVSELLEINRAIYLDCLRCNGLDR
ncbi:MAG: hypothetical protein ABIH18_02975 [Candidatus Omnitrophota bacterium]